MDEKGVLMKVNYFTNKVTNFNQFIDEIKMNDLSEKLSKISANGDQYKYAARPLAIIENYTGTAEKMDQDLLEKIKNGKENEDNCIMLYVVKKTAKKKDIP